MIVSMITAMSMNEKTQAIFLPEQYRAEVIRMSLLVLFVIFSTCRNSLLVLFITGHW